MHSELSEREPVAGTSVSTVMLRSPKVCGPDVTVEALRGLFQDDHVHAALLVDGNTLVSVVERGDILFRHSALRAREVGAIAGRTIGPDADSELIRTRMKRASVRRLAIVDSSMNLLGLLCLKRSGDGFCADAGVQARRDASPRAVGGPITFLIGNGEMVAALGKAAASRDRPSVAE